MGSWSEDQEAKSSFSCKKELKKYTRMKKKEPRQNANKAPIMMLRCIKIRGGVVTWSSMKIEISTPNRTKKVLIFPLFHGYLDPPQCRQRIAGTKIAVPNGSNRCNKIRTRWNERKQWSQTSSLHPGKGWTSNPPGCFGVRASFTNGRDPTDIIFGLWEMWDEVPAAVIQWRQN